MHNQTVIDPPKRDESVNKQTTSPFSQDGDVQFLLERQRVVEKDALDSISKIKRNNEEIDDALKKIVRLQVEIDEKQKQISQLLDDISQRRKSSAPLFDDIEQAQKKYGMCLYLLAVLKSDVANPDTKKAAQDKVADLRAQYNNKEIGRINNFNL